MSYINEESEALLDEVKTESPWSKSTYSRETPQTPAMSRRVLTLLLLCNIVLFVASLTTILYIKGVEFSAKKNEIWSRANAYSPLVGDITIPLSLHQMRGTFLDEDHEILRQKPSPEVDAAWENLTEHGIAYVSSGDIVKMGKDPAVVAKFGPEFGLGPDAYAIETDIIHKIHCLNMIRKDLDFEYYWGDTYPDGVPSERHRLHTNHCVYIILQSLICDANTDLIPQVWVEDYPWATPDFNINRKCGNFDAVKSWEREHRVDPDLYQQMKKPHGQHSLSMSNEWQRVFEVEAGWDAKNGV